MLGEFMGLELKKRVVELLTANPDKRFKARDIAVWIDQTYPEEVAEKLARSDALQTHAEVMNQLVAEIGANRPIWQKQIPQLRTTEGVRPRLYYWTERSEAQEVADVESGREEVIEVALPPTRESGVAIVEKTLVRRSEHDLYPLLTTSAFSPSVRFSIPTTSGYNHLFAPAPISFDDLRSSILSP